MLRIVRLPAYALVILLVDSQHKGFPNVGEKEGLAEL
jgi:hypothetical protein